MTKLDYKIKKTDDYTEINLADNSITTYILRIGLNGDTISYGKQKIGILDLTEGRESRLVDLKRKDINEISRKLRGINVETVVKLGKLEGDLITDGNITIPEYGKRRVA